MYVCRYMKQDCNGIYTCKYKEEAENFNNKLLLNPNRRIKFPLRELGIPRCPEDVKKMKAEMQYVGNIKFKN